MKIFEYNKFIILTFNLLFLLIINKNIANCSVVYLYDQIHFYELKVERPDEIQGLNMQQTFSYYVGGSGKCSNSLDDRISLLDSNENHDGSEDDAQHLKLDANLMIYSNFEQTMSFLIRLNFDSFKIQNNLNVEGFEVVFHNEDELKQDSCIQIIPINKEFINKFQNKFKLTIKDPSFLSVHESRFSLYFGKVSVRALTTCKEPKGNIFYNGKYLCSLEHTRSPKIDIGLKTDKKNFPNELIADLCEGHIMGQTCIMRYGNIQDKQQIYYIIMHPMPKEFDKVTGDLDISNLEPEQLKAYQDAIASGKQVFKIGDNEYPTSSIDLEGYNMMHHIESYHYQKLENGIVIKMVPYASDSINYVSQLNDSSASNPCMYTESVCSCKSECKKCYTLNNPDSIVQYIPLSSRDPKYKPISKNCNEKTFFHQFDFDSVKLETQFQNQKLSNPRVAFNQLKTESFKLANRDTMPRLCFNIEEGDSKYYFNLKIMFNDYQMTGMSSLLEKSIYRYKLYTFTYKDSPSFYKNVAVKDLFPINTVLKINETRPINSTNVIEIKNLNPGKYLIELIPEPRSYLCQSPNECVDESTSNNDFQCVSCNKLVTKFDLTHDMMESIRKEASSFAPKENFVDTGRNLKIKNSIRNSYFSIDSKQTFKCSKDSPLFKSFIVKSILSNKDKRNLLEANLDTKINRDETKNNEYFAKNNIYSSLMPTGFEIETMLLPYEEIPQFEMGGINYNEMFLIVIGLVIALFLILTVMILIFCCESDHSKSNIIVVFYLSVEINKEMQDKLELFVKDLIKTLKKFFKNMNFEIISYQSHNKNFKEREEILNCAHRIIYIGSNEPNKPPTFGQTSYQHEYYKLVRRKNKPIINITFNPDMLPNKTKSKKNYIYIKNADEQNTISDASMFALKENFYVLPCQTKELIYHLIKSTHEVRNDKASNRINNRANRKSLKQKCILLKGLAEKLFVFRVGYSLNKLVLKNSNKNNDLFKWDNHDPLDEEYEIVSDDDYDDDEDNSSERTTTSKSTSNQLSSASSNEPIDLSSEDTNLLSTSSK